MFNISKSKKKNQSLTSVIVVFAFNILMMFLLGLFEKKVVSPTRKKLRNFTEGEIVE